MLSKKSRLNQIKKWGFKMKTALVYASVHHGNTEKVVKAIAEKHPEVELMPLWYLGTI